MVGKRLDDIVLEDDVKERIRPLFERATASDDISFDHDWQWRAYCDVLYGVTEFAEIVTWREINVGGNRSYGWGEIGPLLARRSFKDVLNTGKLPSMISTITRDVARNIREMHSYNNQMVGLLRNSLKYLSPLVYVEDDRGDLNDVSINLSEAVAKERIERIIEVTNTVENRVLSSAKDMIPYLLRICILGHSVSGERKRTYLFGREEIIALQRFDDDEIKEMESFLCEKKRSIGEVMKLFSLLRREEYQKRREKFSRVAEVLECLEINIPGYQVIKRIGEGRWRRVYKAWNEQDECYVAVKVRKPIEEVTSPNKEARKEYGLTSFSDREGKIARYLEHPNIVRYFTRGTLDDGRVYIIEGFVPGRTLKNRIELFDFDPHDPYSRGDILLQVVNGLAYMHRYRYVHRDIKPENIIVPDTLDPVKIADLELVKKLEDIEEITPIHGSNAYCAPELLIKGRLTPAADIFSFGLVMYETYTGQHAFVFDPKESEDRTAIANNIKNQQNYERVMRKIDNPEHIMMSQFDREVLKHCLAYDPLNRFQTATDILSFREQYINRSLQSKE